MKFHSILFFTKGIATVVLLSILGALVYGQDTFVAIPKQQISGYQIDFARNFFASPQAEAADRATLYVKLKEMETLKGKLAISADNLQRALELFDAVQVQLERHNAYLYLRSAVNTKDKQSPSENFALYAEVTSRSAFVQQELMAIDDKTLRTFVARKASLKKYLFAIQDVQRYRRYMLPLQEEELLRVTDPTRSGWQADLYDMLPAPDASQRDFYAFTLTRLVTALNQTAKLHHYEDAPSKAYFSRYWSKAEVNDLLEQIARRADLYKHYQTLRAEHLKKTASVEDKSSPSAFKPPRFTIAEGSEIIRAALEPLGREYGEELTKLLDPANGRMDIVPGENRKPGGFSRGFIGTDSVFFSGGFAGSYNDVRVLAHESTHAVHRQLMNRNHVLPDYASGPNYLFESFAIFSELLLADYQYKHQTDSRLKQFYLEQFLDGKGTIMFVCTPEAMLEQAIYEGVLGDRIKGADDLDAISEKIYAPFCIPPQNHEELKNQWMNIPLMYEDPFYDVNYIYGGLLALKYYERFTRDPKHFTERYAALMRNGFDASPATLLKRFLAIDLDDPNLASGAIDITERKVDLLEKSYLK